MSIQFPPKEEFLAYVLTRPLEKIYYANLIPSTVFYNNAYYWSLALLALTLLLWIIARLASHTSVPHGLTKHLADSSLATKEQQAHQRLTGLRLLLPIDWLAKGSI